MANSRRGAQVPPRARSAPHRRFRKNNNRGEGQIEMMRRREFFVPSFSVRRPVLATEEVKEFHSWLSSYLKRGPYEASSLGFLGLLLVEQKGLIKVFHDSDVQPNAQDMLDVAQNVRSDLQDHLKSKPRNLSFIPGSVYAFGEKENKIAVVPEGWKGYRSRYAKKNEQGEYQMNAEMVSEANIVIGGIANSFTRGVDSKGEESAIDTRPLFARTPHITLGQKKRGGKISADEIAELNGVIGEHMPEKLPLYDPIVHLRLQPESGNIFTDVCGESVEYSQTMFVRSPKIREFGHLLMSYSAEDAVI